jgi:hypothetical protein
MFEDLKNKCDEHWSTSSGVAPSPTNLSHKTSPINVDDEEEGNINDDSEPEEVTPTSGKGKRR